MLTGPGAAGRSKRQLSLNLMLRALRAQASQLARTPISERSHNIGLGRRPLAHLTSPSVTAQAQQCNPSVAQQSCTSVKFQGCSPQASTSRSSTRHAAMALQLGTTLATPVRGPRSTLPGTASLLPAVSKLAHRRYPYHELATRYQITEAVLVVLAQTQSPAFTHRQSKAGSIRGQRRCQL